MRLLCLTNINQHKKILMEIESSIESLLFRYLRGEVTDEEITKVESWINASPENQKLMEQQCVLDFANESMLCMQNANPSRSLSKVKQKIRKNKIRRFFKWTQRIAAALFIPLLCLTLFGMLQSKEEVKREEPQLIGISSAPGVVTTIVLPDGSKVWLNSNSQIMYPSYFEGDTREVSIIGEAYFTVIGNPEKPFFVNVNNTFNLKVTGTEFNIEAYPSTSTFLTTLVKGSVELVSAHHPGNSILTLNPGEQALWDTNEKTLNVRKVNTIAFTSWKDGKIIFKNSPIDEIAATLGKRFNANFLISPGLKDYCFTGTFTNLQLVQILEHFKISSNIRYEIKGLELNADGTVNSTIVELKQN